MEELGFARLEEFADYYGIGRTTVYSLVIGRTTAKGTTVKPSIDTLVKLADALNVPAHILLYELEPAAPGTEFISPEGITNGLAQELPARRLELHLTGWTEDTTHQTPSGPEKAVWVDADYAKGKVLQAFRVYGDAMAAGKTPIHHGDVVLVDTRDKGTNTDAVVARLLDGRSICKVLKDDKFGRLLQSRNADHTNGTPSVIPLSEVAQIIGKVVRIIHDEV